MKGRKTKIAEQRALLIDSLQRRFPEQKHLVEGFLHECDLHRESEAWIQLTEAGIAHMFERFLAPPVADKEKPSNPVGGDISELAVIRDRIAWLERQLSDKPDLARTQKILLTEIIEPLTQLNKKWLRATLG